MKKRIILATFVMAWHVLVMGNSFSGYYGSVNLGVISTNVEHISSITLFLPGTFNITNSDNVHGAKAAFNGGLAFGFGWEVIPVLILGIEGRWNFDDVDTDFNALVTETNSELRVLREGSVKLKNDWSLLLKVSSLLEPNTLFYGLVGPQWGNFDSDARESYTQNLGVLLTSNIEGTSKSKYLTGLLLGVGMEHLFSEHFSMGIEYAYSFYRKSTAPDEVGILSSPIDGSTGTLMNEVHPRINVGSLKFTYYI